MPTRIMGAREQMGKAQKGGRGTPLTPLWKRVGELGASSALILYLADMGSDRLSLTQAAFFMLAATAEAAGRPATRSDIINTYPDNFRGSIRNSYRQLLVPSRLYPKGLGWLDTEENPNDSREKVLRLTLRGKEIVEGALLAMQPITDGDTANVN